MSKNRNIADLGSNDVLETTSTGVEVNGTLTASEANVTGTVTTDGLTVDGDATIKSATGATFVIEDTSTSQADGAFLGGIKFQNNDTSGTPPHGTGIKVTADDVYGHMYMDFLSGNRTAWDTDLKAMRISNGGDISFYEDTGTTAKFFWDASAESLGIGTSSPSNKLDIAGAGAGQVVSVDVASEFMGDATTKHTNLLVSSSNNTSSNASLSLRSRSSGSQWYYSQIVGSNAALDFYVADSVNSYPDSADLAMRIDSSGNVGIGTSSPSSHLTLKRGSPLFKIQDSTTSYSSIDSKIAYSGSHSGGDYRTDVQWVVGSDANNFTWSYGSSEWERMRIDSSGNLLVGGTTSPADSGAIVASGGVYLGGTGSANHLDDYEEGTFTGTLADATTGGNTSTSSTGYYTKIGQLVTIHLTLSNVSKGSMTTGNSLYVRGLPFATSAIAVGSCTLARMTYPNDKPVPRVGSSTTYMVFPSETNSNDNNNYVKVSDIVNDGASDISITLSYRTDA